MNTWVLIFILYDHWNGVGAGFDVEFNSKAACDTARQYISKQYNPKRKNGALIVQCFPKEQK